MKSVVVLGDSTTHGGTVITASSKMVIKGKPVALVGDSVSCPQRGHGVTAIIDGSKTLFHEGRAVAINGSKCGCGCQVLAGASPMQAN